jgi:hypothetical protein
MRYLLILAVLFFAMPANAQQPPEVRYRPTPEGTIIAAPSPAPSPEPTLLQKQQYVSHFRLPPQLRH